MSAPDPVRPHDPLPGFHRGSDIVRRPSAGRDELVLAAATEEEFLALLRRMLDWSGRTAGSVATYAKLPRSTAYHFVSFKNQAIPTSADQVEAFARGCRLDDEQVAQVMRIWRKLSGIPENQLKLPRLDTDDQRADFIIDGQHRNGEWLRYIGHRTPHPIADDVSETTAQIAGTPNIGRVSGDVNIVYNVGGSNTDDDGEAGLPRPRRGRLQQLRLDVLMLLGIAAVPVILHDAAGTLAGAILLPVTVQVGVYRWWGKLRKSVAAAPVAAAATAAAAAAAGLSWVTAHVLFLAVSTGFIIFVVTPMWITATHTTWIRLSLGHRLGAVVTAGWVGTAAGLLAAARCGTVTGGILVGLLAGAGMLMEAATLQGKTPPDPATP